MAFFSIGEVERITGIKTHILRYWEEIIPSLSPKKDIGRRRIYTNRDVQVILRLKHLITVKKFTIEGARNQLIDDLAFENSEAGQKKAEAYAQIQELRGELLDILQVFDSSKTKDIL